jgi:uncharacterized membrane protein
MAELIVLACPTQEGASQLREKAKDLQDQHLMSLDDAAVVVRRPDGKVKIKHAASLVGEGALGGSFWGLLIGLIFLAPFLGAAIGALAGGIAGKFVDVGVDTDFMKEVGDSITPGTSALFLMVGQATPDKVMDAFRPSGCKVLQTSLTKEQEQKLRDNLGAAEVSA